MTLMVAVLVAGGILLWPDRFSRRAVAIVPAARPDSETFPRPVLRPGWWLRWRRGRGGQRVSAHDLLELLEAVAPALEAGLAPASALRVAVESRSGPGRASTLDALVERMAAAAADGDPLGPLWRAEAESESSAELLLLAHAWSLTEDMGAPLSQAVRTAAGMLEGRIAQERRLASAVAGAGATVNLLSVLPVAGLLVAMVLGIGPDELFAGSRLTQASLVLGVCLAGLGRWWVRQMVRAVSRGPVIA